MSNYYKFSSNQQEFFETLYEITSDDDISNIYASNEYEITCLDEEKSCSQSSQNLKRKREEDDSIDFESQEMKIFQTTRKVYKKLKGHSDIDKNDSETQFLWSEYYHVFGKLNPLSEFDRSCVGRILKPKKKIKLKHVKKVVKDDLEEGVIAKNDIRFIAGNAGITRSAFKYCRHKRIFVLEVLKTVDDVVVLYKPFKHNKDVFLT
ncbi:4097_t:CDS:2 [Dentiscutata heterogama]|uniref:4097_t:CDS:1 n=1 Tax=Dentiscutata heterogama TaxID=1316150 RepID=A0ACA9KZ24_9GLOM|nr:4097_t:CDS:2 [Dentiscutata heterogama]